MQRDTDIIKKRKRFWDIMGFGYLTENVFHKKHSLNCGCGFCRAKTYYRRLENKQDRLTGRVEIKKRVEALTWAELNGFNQEEI